MKFVRIILFLIAPIVLIGCGSGGYVVKTSKARADYVNGRYDKALTRYQKIKVRSQDRLLQLMDLGTVAHSAGHYQKSLKYFDEAIAMALSKEGAQTASKIASLVSSDNQIPYQGEDFEKLLLHFYQVLNYIGLGKPQEALIEVRRLFTYYADFFKPSAKSYLQNAAVSYINGLVWELNGLMDDADIDYKATHRIRPNFKPVLSRLNRTINNPNQGTVVILIAEGESPQKSSTEERSNYKIIPVPTYRHARFDAPPRYQITENNQKITESIPLYRCDQAAKDTLDDQKSAIIARAIARLATKESAAVAVGTQVDPQLGALFGFLLLATNKADIRSWLTLPRSFQIAEVNLNAGDHTLVVEGGDQEKKINITNLKARTNQIVTVRVF